MDSNLVCSKKGTVDSRTGSGAMDPSGHVSLSSESLESASYGILTDSGNGKEETSGLTSDMVLDYWVCFGFVICVFEVLLHLNQM